MKAKRPFWLDGGYDYESVRGCRYHPHHRWRSYQLGELLHDDYFTGLDDEKRDEWMTICVACYVPRCGTTDDIDRCTLHRHHHGDHILESGRRVPVGGLDAAVA